MKCSRHQMNIHGTNGHQYRNMCVYSTVHTTATQCKYRTLYMFSTSTVGTVVDTAQGQCVDRCITSQTTRVERRPKSSHSACTDTYTYLCSPEYVSFVTSAYRLQQKTIQLIHTLMSSLDDGHMFSSTQPNTTSQQKTQPIPPLQYNYRRYSSCR